MCTLLAAEFHETQVGTVHFHYLHGAGGGLVHVARDFREHLLQLDAALHAGVEDDARCRRFVEAFIALMESTLRQLQGSSMPIETAATRPAIDGRPSWVVARLLRPKLRRRAVRAERDAALRLEAKAAERKMKSQLAKQQKKRRKKEQKRGQAESGEPA